MAQDEQMLFALVRDALQRAEGVTDSLQHILVPGRRIEEVEQELDEVQQRLRVRIKAVLVNLRILAERLGLPQTRLEIVDFEKAQEDLAAYDVDPEEFDVIVPALNQVRHYVQTFDALVNPNPSQLDVFRTILQHTAKIIDEAELQPTKEAEVRNTILRITSYAFTDAIKEVPLPQSVKTYRGDIGVPSIKAVAEYKFAKTATEMKACLDGIYADMKGYDGHSSWQHFFAVFYMAKPFYTQDHIEREFKRVGAASNWTPIVINGPTAQV